MGKLILILVFISMSMSAQELRYVTARNGLIVRDSTEARIGKLEYGSEVEVTNRTGKVKLIRDNGKRIQGEWVEIISRERDDTLEGVVFDGFLTNDKLSKRFKIKFSQIELVLDSLGLGDTKLKSILRREDTLKLSDPRALLKEGTTLRITNYENDKLRISQSFDLSIPVIDNLASCNFAQWKKSLSKWVVLQQDKNEFTVKPLTPRVVNKLKKKYRTAIKKECTADSDSRSEVRSNINKIRKDDVEIHKILFKIEVEDSLGTPIQNIIEFSLPN